MTVQLRGYQTDAINAFIQSPWQRSLVVLSTGMGKTITGLALAKQMGGRCLWLAHREELITQPGKALQLVWPGVTYGQVKAERNEYMRQVVFASIQSAQQQRRIDQLVRERFDLVVVDEAHHALSPGYKQLLEALGCWKEGGPKLLGLTATPERSDNGALEDVFQGIVFQVGITSAIEGGYLVPPRVVERPIAVDLDSVTVSRGDYGQKQLDIALMQAGIVGEITAAYEEHCAAKKSLIFVVSVAQAEAVADALRARGHAVAAVSGETPKEQRRSILRKLATGELRCVVNCMVLTEGFDEPSIDALILARPTQSKPLMIQMVGRGLRLYPNKIDCLVVDLVAATKRNSLIQAAVLFGLKADPKEKPKPTQLDPIGDAEEYWRQRFLSQIKGVKGAPRSKLRWLPTNDGLGWLLAAGEYGTIRMLPQGEEWSVDVVGAREGERFQRLSDAPVNMETAQAIAEDMVRRVKAVELASGQAKWRDQPASPAQIAALKRAGIDATNMTKGTAADIMTQRSAEPATPKQIASLRRMGAKVHEGITKREASRLFAMQRG
jgi:superfamily II DNA or RNA helicase